MTDSTTDQTANRFSPDRMALLHTLAFTALRLCVAQLDAFSTRLADALDQAATQAGSTEADLLRHAHEHLSRHRATFHRLAADSLQQELLRAVQSAGEHLSAGLENGAMDLSLITFEAMERKVLLDNLSQTLDAGCADLLAVLNMRISHWLDTEEIGAAHNPFRSQVFLKAVSDAWSKFDLQGAAHRVVLRQLGPEVFLSLEPVLRALNQEFAARLVLPDAEQTYRNRKAVPETILEASHQDSVRQWLAPEGLFNAIEERALALLDGMFAQLEHNETIPAVMRSLLARLEPTLRAAALADKNFFFSERHPARRLIETMLMAGLGCAEDAGGNGGREDSLCQSIESAVAPLMPPVVSRHAQFDAVLANLDALIERHKPGLDARLGASIAEAVKQENIANAQLLADEEVAARIENGEIDAFIEVFLQMQWTRVLSFAYGMRVAKPDILPNVLNAMDDLIRSTQPKNTPQARKELVDSLPALLAVLNAWLNVVKWEGPERETFFAALAERHAAALHAPHDLPPRTQLEMRLNVMQKASEHELSRRAQEQQEAALAVFMRKIDTLVAGNWAEFVRNDGSKLNCKLLWISPARSRFIFAGRQGSLMFTLADEALANALRAGRVNLIARGGMVEHAFAQALRELC